MNTSFAPRPAVAVAFVLLLLSGIVPVAAQQSAAITGVVTGPNGGVVSNAQIELIGAAARARSVATDGSGRFRFDGVPAGEFTLRVTASGYLPIDQLVRIEGSASVVADVRFELLRLPGLTATVAGSYVVETASTATKIDVPIRETPVSLQAIPEVVLSDQRVNRLQEALENVSGVRSNNNDLSGYVYKLRGFSSLSLYRNALAVTYAIPTIQETANIERVEVLKGPASILFGRVEPGGAINMVTKRPQPEAAYSIEQEVGTYSHFRTQLDATGALNGDGSVAYRISGAFQDHGSFRDFQGGQRTFVAPALSIGLGESTDLLLDFQYLKNEAQPDIGTPGFLTTGAPPVIPLERSFQEPNDPRDRTESYNIGYELEHRLGDAWAIRNYFLHSDADMWNLNVVGSDLDEATGDLDRVTQHQRLLGTVYATTLDLSGRFDVLGARHNLLLGVDYLRDYYDYQYSNDDGGHVVNIFNPVYGGVTDTDYQNAFTGGSSGPYLSSFLVRQSGVYLQDQIAWGNWRFLLGGRYDRAVTDGGSSSTTREDAIADRKASPDDRDNEFTPRLGALYDVSSSLSTYASYSRSFGRNNGRDQDGNTLPPETGTQYEVGVKAELAEGLSATAAVYELTKGNVVQQVSPTVARAIGEVRSRGVEADLQGTLTPRLSVLASYALTRTEVTNDNGGLQGNELDNAPRHTARVFGRYDFGSEGRGWRAGGGFYAASRASANRENEVWLPAFARADAFAAYTRRVGGVRWTAQLNVRNLFDREYFEGSDIFYFYYGNSRLYLLAGQPRTATVTLTLEF